MLEALFSIWEFIVNLCEPLLLYAILRNKLKCTPSKNILALLGIIVLAVETTIMNNYNLPYIYTLFIMLASYILYSLLLFDGKLIQRILWPTSMVFIILLSNTILTNIVVLLPSVSAAETYMPTLARFIITAIYVLLDATFAFNLIKFTKKNSPTPVYILLGVICLCLLSITSLYLMIEIAYQFELAGLDANVCIIVSFILLTLSVFIIILFSRLSKSIQKSVVAQNEAIALQREMAYNNELENVYRNLRQLRHDYASHMDVILSLLDNNKMDELKEYMAEYHAEYKAANYFALTNNTKLDALLASKLSLCESLGIETNVAFRYWGDIGLTSMELVSLFGNLLDNAMNACENVDGKKVIRLTTQKVKDMLSINISNTYNKSVDSIDRPSRPGHGLGLPRIRSIIDKYDGLCDISPLEDTFEVEIMLRLIASNNEQDN